MREHEWTTDGGGSARTRLAAWLDQPAVRNTNQSAVIIFNARDPGPGNLAHESWRPAGPLILALDRAPDPRAIFSDRDRAEA